MGAVGRGWVETGWQRTEFLGGRGRRSARGGGRTAGQVQVFDEVLETLVLVAQRPHLAAQVVVLAAQLFDVRLAAFHLISTTTTTTTTSTTTTTTTTTSTIRNSESKPCSLGTSTPSQVCVFCNLGQFF